MENSPKVDVELYEEIVGDPNYSTMNSSPSSSTHDVRELPPSQEPMPYSGNAETSLATTPRSALRPQLAGYPKEPRTVAVTCSGAVLPLPSCRCRSPFPLPFRERATELWKLSVFP